MRPNPKNNKILSWSLILSGSLAGPLVWTTLAFTEVSESQKRFNRTDAMTLLKSNRSLKETEVKNLEELVGQTLDLFSDKKIPGFQRKAFEDLIQKGSDALDIQNKVMKFQQKYDTDKNPPAGQKVVQAVQKRDEERVLERKEQNIASAIQTIMDQTGIRSTGGKNDLMGRRFTDKNIKDTESLLHNVLKDVEDEIIIPPVLSKQSVVSELINRLGHPRNMLEVIRKIQTIYKESDLQDRLSAGAILHEQKLDQSLKEAEAHFQKEGMRTSYLRITYDAFLKARPISIETKLYAMAEGLVRSLSPQKQKEFQAFKAQNRSGFFLLFDKDLETLLSGPAKDRVGVFKVVLKAHTFDYEEGEKFFTKKPSRLTYFRIDLDGRGLKNLKKVKEDLDAGRIDIYEVSRFLLFAIPTGGSKKVSSDHEKDEIWSLTTLNPPEISGGDLRVMNEIYVGDRK